jgi:hypothetical protein
MEKKNYNPKELTYEIVMEMFAETREQIRETGKQITETSLQMKETDKKFAETDRKFAEAREQIKEADKILTEKFAETRRLIEANAKQIGGIDRSNGLMAEEAVYNALKKDNIFANVKFDYIRQNVAVQSEDHQTLTELDILMVNTDSVAIIESKYKVEKKDVFNIWKTKLKYFRQYNPKYNNHKIILGIAGMSFEDNAEDEAKKHGIGIIKIIGDKVEFYTEGLQEY